MRWRKRKTLPIRPWYDVDDEERELARHLLNERLETADRERRALHRDWFGLLSRIHALLQQEDRGSELAAAIDEELDRLENDPESMLDVVAWKDELRTWADEYIATAGTFHPPRPPV